jgi:hypothetical protein
MKGFLLNNYPEVAIHVARYTHKNRLTGCAARQLQERATVAGGSLKFRCRSQSTGLDPFSVAPKPDKTGQNRTKAVNSGQSRANPIFRDYHGKSGLIFTRFTQRTSHTMG